MFVDPVMFVLMVLGGVSALFLFTFATRVHEVGRPQTSYWFTAKLAVGLAVGASPAFLLRRYFAPYPLRAIYLMLFGLVGLFVIILGVRSRCFKREG